MLLLAGVYVAATPDRPIRRQIFVCQKSVEKISAGRILSRRKSAEKNKDILISGSNW